MYTSITIYIIASFFDSNLMTIIIATTSTCTLLYTHECHFVAIENTDTQFT